jgi:hypothetical protein
MQSIQSEYNAAAFIRTIKKEKDKTTREKQRSVGVVPSLFQHSVSFKFRRLMGKSV